MMKFLNVGGAWWGGGVFDLKRSFNTDSLRSTCKIKLQFSNIVKEEVVITTREL